MSAPKEVRKQRREQIASEIISSKEALEILGVSRMRLSQYVNDGRVKPIRSGIYLKDDIVAFKEAFREARSNNEWLKTFE
ncbi:hypothetical protein [Virgibacillus sp. L01]|uniref:hypothetical protein n=1 Tax=Virgibacillus sp. L01 TaxID=3457429 RepID=UPI003FD3062C